MRARYVFEHIMIPYLLDRRGGDFVSVMLMRGKRMLYQLCASSYAQNGEEMKYTEDDFGFEASRLDDKNVCMTLCMPEPDEPGDCKKIYILSSSEPFYTSFFTCEDDGEGGLLLCSQSDDIRLTFGKFDDEKKALSLMLGVHKDNNGRKQ